MTFTTIIPIYQTFLALEAYIQRKDSPIEIYLHYPSLLAMLYVVARDVLCCDKMFHVLSEISVYAHSLFPTLSKSHGRGANIINEFGCIGNNPG
jgi:hypothetical protein